MQRTMAARFHGTCPKCRTAIIPGHTISKGSSGWGHFRCTQGKDDLRRSMTTLKTIIGPVLEPQAGTDAFNRRWAEFKNDFARLEAEQEQVAYLTEMRAEEELFRKHEGM